MSSSGGNAGLAAVFCAQELGIPITVVVPEPTPPFIVQKLKEEGATVEVVGKVSETIDGIHGDTEWEGEEGVMCCMLVIRDVHVEALIPSCQRQELRLGVHVGIRDTSESLLRRESSANPVTVD